jgi:hypothetical protein
MFGSMCLLRYCKLFNKTKSCSLSFYLAVVSAQMQMQMFSNAMKETWGEHWTNLGERGPSLEIVPLLTSLANYVVWHAWPEHCHEEILQIHLPYESQRQLMEQKMQCLWNRWQICTIDLLSVAVWRHWMKNLQATMPYFEQQSNN